ncbi:hypothetical protein NUSPORA_00892 [Nucleospora cyclopteri]
MPMLKKLLFIFNIYTSDLITENLLYEEQLTLKNVTNLELENTIDKLDFKNTTHIEKPTVDETTKEVITKEIINNNAFSQHPDLLKIISDSTNLSFEDTLLFDSSIFDQTNNYDIHHKDATQTTQETSSYIIPTSQQNEDMQNLHGNELVLEKNVEENTCLRPNFFFFEPSMVQDINSQFKEPNFAQNALQLLNNTIDISYKHLHLFKCQINNIEELKHISIHFSSSLMILRNILESQIESIQQAISKQTINALTQQNANVLPNTTINEQPNLQNILCQNLKDTNIENTKYEDLNIINFDSCDQSIISQNSLEEIQSSETDKCKTNTKKTILKNQKNATSNISFQNETKSHSLIEKQSEIPSSSKTQETNKISSVINLNTSASSGQLCIYSVNHKVLETSNNNNSLTCFVHNGDVIITDDEEEEDYLNYNEPYKTPCKMPLCNFKISNKKANEIVILNTNYDFFKFKWYTLLNTEDEIETLPKNLIFIPGWYNYKILCKSMSYGKLKSPYFDGICQMYGLKKYFTLIYNIIRLNTYNKNNSNIQEDILFHIVCNHLCTQYDLGNGKNFQLNKMNCFYNYINNENYYKMFKSKEYWMNKAAVLYENAKKQAKSEFNISNSTANSIHLYNFLLLIPLKNPSKVAFVLYVYYGVDFGEIAFDFKTIFYNKEGNDYDLLEKTKSLYKIYCEYHSYMQKARVIYKNRRPRTQKKKK